MLVCTVLKYFQVLNCNLKAIRSKTKSSDDKKDNQTSDFAFGNHLHFVNFIYYRPTYSKTRRDWELHMFEFEVSFPVYHIWQNY